jgi:hypothetical protein
MHPIDFEREILAIFTEDNNVSTSEKEREHFKIVNTFLPGKLGHDSVVCLRPESPQQFATLPPQLLLVFPPDRVHVRFLDSPDQIDV